MSKGSVDQKRQAVHLLAHILMPCRYIDALDFLGVDDHNAFTILLSISSLQDIS